MFQGINLLPLATVERNLQLCAEMAMLPKKQWTQRVDDLVERLGLESLRHKKAGSLSGGQAQRAALARTLMKESDILLLDEARQYVIPSAPGRRFKDDDKEVAGGYECGMQVEKFNDIKVGDVIECFVMEQINA